MGKRKREVEEMMVKMQEMQEWCTQFINQRSKRARAASTDRDSDSGEDSSPSSNRSASTSESGNESQKENEETNDNSLNRDKENEERIDENNLAGKADVEAEPEPDEVFVELLGDDPQKSKALDMCIHSSIRSRWEYWLKHGVPANEKAELLELYQGPAFLESPMLNIEIKSTLKEHAIKRDTCMSEIQHLAGSALTSLGSVMSLLMTEKESIDQWTIFKRLRDASKLIIEIFYRQSENRKSFITPGLAKDVKNLAQEATTDTFLFGKDFGPNLKEAEAIKKLTKKIKRRI